MSEDLSKELRRIRDRKLENLLRTFRMKKELINKKSTGTLPERTLIIEFSDDERKSFRTMLRKTSEAVDKLEIEIYSRYGDRFRSFTKAFSDSSEAILSLAISINGGIVYEKYQETRSLMIRLQHLLSRIIAISEGEIPPSRVLEP